MSGKGKKKVSPKDQAWIDARKRHHLSPAQVQMARELGLNPRKLGKIDNHRQQPGKLPLPAFIAQLHEKRFGRRKPESATSIGGGQPFEQEGGAADLPPLVDEGGFFPGGESEDEGPSSWGEHEAYGAAWKLYWCESEDHDEDWFVVARSDDDARAFHERAEGYDDDEAWAGFVCVLPPAVQEAAEAKGDHWPSTATLLACGAEFLPCVRRDGQGELRAQMGSDGRVVRIDGRVCAEGDIVGNVLLATGQATTS
jgi:hypothetical protein